VGSEACLGICELELIETGQMHWIWLPSKCAKKRKGTVLEALARSSEESVVIFECVRVWIEAGLKKLAHLHSNIRSYVEVDPLTSIELIFAHCAIFTYLWSSWMSKVKQLLER
jgi:hypothetical protein